MKLKEENIYLKKLVQEKTISTFRIHIFIQNVSRHVSWHALFIIQWQSSWIFSFQPPGPSRRIRLFIARHFIVQPSVTGTVGNGSPADHQMIHRKTPL
ncbi:hypothetical protein ACOMHN_052340 [Nucella lapillus]